MLRPLAPFLFIGCCLTASLLSEIPYKVEYKGIKDGPALKTIKSITQLSTLKKKPPDSIPALKYRAESDIPEILKVLHAHGYYDASVQIFVTETSSGATVVVRANLGPVYRISSFSLSLFQGSEDKLIECPDLDTKELGIEVGSRILAIDVINGELKAMQKLSDCGYPLATVKDRSIVADGDTKTVSIHLSIDTGPLSYFGPLSLDGNTSVRPRFFSERLSWKENEVYSGKYVEETQKTLMDSGLFSSILITHENAEDPTGSLPMKIEVAESKHKSIYGGVSYQTYYGPGLTFGWEHRNLGGMGRRLTLQGDITKRSHSGVATFLVPNFLRVDQDYVWQAQAIHLNILPFSERSYHLTTRLERKFTKQMRISFGLTGEHLFVTSSVHNGEYWILGVPIFLGLNFANDLLNPTKGFNFEYTSTPTLIYSPDRRSYFKQDFAISHYLPIGKNHTLTIAQKVSGGCILSGGEGSVPVSKRFFGGSEEDLRGYAYYSVSPVNSSGKPEGGRSAVYYTFETRLRVSKTIGFVPFFDLGNVTKDRFPTLQGQWLKSAGIGLRYFSFVGPFRLDVGFPINRRKGIDKKYRILVSVGQSF